MRKGVIILSTLVLIAGSCGQSPKNQVATTNNDAIIEQHSEKKIKYFYRANGGSVIFFDDGTAYRCARCELVEDLENYEPNITYKEFPTYLLMEGDVKWELYDENGYVTIDWVVVNYEQTEKNVINKLHKSFQYFFENSENHYFDTEYYANVNCIGLGVINPKDFRFQLMTDTPDRQKIEIDNIEEQELLVPLFWKPDYSIFYMTVVEISDNQYRVQANNEMTVWVNKSEFDFYTWEDLLNKTTCVVANIAYREKDINSESIKYTGEDGYALIVEKVEDDWLYVKAETEEDVVVGHYWVLWKDKNNNLLVQPIFLM